MANPTITINVARYTDDEFLDIICLIGEYVPVNTMDQNIRLNASTVFDPLRMSEKQCADFFEIFHIGADRMIRYK